MAYRLKPGRPVSEEVLRIADTQCKLALDALHGVGTRADDKTTHRARRHIKKVRALADLFQLSLAPSRRLPTLRLRRVSRLLAPVADGEAVVDTFVRIRKKYGSQLPRQIAERIQAGLVQLEFHADRKATFDRALDTAVRLLRAEQAHVRVWRLDKSGFDAVAPGLNRSMRRARRAMALTLEHPRAEHYHLWRRRVKDLWLQVRLIQERCGGQLATEADQLERLDGCLGEYHNCVLLAGVLTAEPLAPRQGTAQCLRVVRRYQEELRRELHPLAAETLKETPRQFVRRTRQLWRRAKRNRKTTTRLAWRRAA